MAPVTVRRRIVALVAAGCLTLLVVAPAEATTAVVLDAPVEPITVTSLASLPPQNWLAGHRGIDLEAYVGDTVTASAAGEVTYVGIVVDRPVVSVQYAGGLVSSVEPVDALVRVGDVVRAGDNLGTVTADAGHCAPARCVHWGLRREGVYVDPLDYLRGFGPVRLLPLDVRVRSPRRTPPFAQGSRGVSSPPQSGSGTPATR